VLVVLVGLPVLAVTLLPIVALAVAVEEIVEPLVLTVVTVLRVL
jgi:hypothetical protein